MTSRTSVIIVSFRLHLGMPVGYPLALTVKLRGVPSCFIGVVKIGSAGALGFAHRASGVVCAFLRWDSGLIHLGGESPLDPIGREVKVNGVPFEVIGVFDLSTNIFASIAGNIAILPYTTAIKHLDASDEGLVVFAVPAADVTQAAAMDEVITLLRTRRGLAAADSNNFALMRQEQMVDTFNRFTGVFFLVMIALSSVALMVGGVGVIAIMMIAVTERTREIGIRKAVGATRSEILWQFLIEAVTVTVIGAVIGMAIGGGGAFLVAALTPLPAAVPFSAVVAALTMAAVARGWQVTHFNRGRRDPDGVPGVETLIGDRNGELDALKGREWDAVIDT